MEKNIIDDILIFEGIFIIVLKWKGIVKEYDKNKKLIYEGEYNLGKRNGKGLEYNELGNIIYDFE